MKKTKIIATIGPASTEKSILSEMVDKGLNTIRLNMSHGDYDEQQERIDTIREIAKEKNQILSVLLDTKGPEIRTGLFEEDFALLEKGNQVVITMEDVTGTAERFTVSYKGLVDDVNIGDVILLDDGYVAVKVLEKDAQNITTEILNSGKLKDRRGVNVPGVSLNFDFMSEKDKSDIEFAADQDLDYIAISFVRNAQDVREVREILKAKGNDHVQLISKIENQESVANIDEIIAESDGIMVARGDLGVEVPAEDVPVIQKEIIEKCNKEGKVVVTATQMLESMQNNPRPTRAEVSDVFNAVMDGTDAVMLSGESAAGDFPVESVATQARISNRAEDAYDYETYLEKQLKNIKQNVTELVAYSAVSTANVIEDAKLIIAVTTSGTTAKVCSRMKPKFPILAVSSDESTLRSLVLNYAVIPAIVKAEDVEGKITEAIAIAKEKGLVVEGDEIVVAAGNQYGAGTTDYMKVVVA